MIGTAHAATSRLIAIAASAGGIPAIQTVLAAFPADLRAAVIILLHRTAREKDLLVRVLQRATHLRVKLAEPGEELHDGVAYVAPADQHVLVAENRQLQFTNGRRISHLLCSADPLFRSAAQAFGTGLIAVVLTGSGRNGAGGVPVVREHGGIVLAQDKETSAYFSMPEAAIGTGAVNMVLPIQRIGPTLVRLLNGRRAPAGAA